VAGPGAWAKTRPAALEIEALLVSKASRKDPVHLCASEVNISKRIIFLHTNLFHSFVQNSGFVHGLGESDPLVCVDVCADFVAI